MGRRLTVVGASWAVTEWQTILDLLGSGPGAVSGGWASALPLGVCPYDAGSARDLKEVFEHAAGEGLIEVFRDPF